jgi:uncharacterized membrane protein
MNKYLVIFFAIVALIVAAFIGSYVFALGAFLFKVMLGLVALIIFSLGFAIGRFFPRKNDKELLKG